MYGSKIGPKNNYLHVNHAIIPLNNTRYDGNKTYNQSCPTQIASAKAEDTAPNIHATDFSEAGFRQAFPIVGIPSKASANIAKLVVIHASLDT